MYGKVDFKEITYTHGDSFDRYMVRMDEIMESCRIIEQLIDNVPEGEFRVKTKPILKLPEGVFTASVEASRGDGPAVGACHGHRVPGREDSRPDCHRRYDGLRDTGY